MLSYLVRQMRVIIVDEPELNLNPSLAIDLWDAIEGSKKDAVFVYATHCLSFAMRPSVTDVLVLRLPDQEPLHLHAPFDWSDTDLAPFLGSIPAIITSRRLLVVEGKDGKSFDTPFYRWITGGSITIANVGSCDSVRAAVRRLGVWEKIGTAALCGVVDRDYRDDHEIERLEGSNVVCLHYNAAESYLCVPELIAAASIHSGANVPKAGALDQILEFCRGQEVKTALLRTIERSKIRLRIGPDKNTHWPKDEQSALNALDEWAAKEQPRADNLRTMVQENFKQEFARCKKSVSDKNVDEMLALFPGKPLAEKMARYAGFQTVGTLLKSAAANLVPEDYAPLKQIIAAIQRAWI